MSNNNYDSLDHEWLLKEDFDVLEPRDWDGESSISLTISGVEVAEIFGTDHGGCIDEEDEDYPKIVADMQFVSRLLLNSKDMYQLLEKISGIPSRRLTEIENAQDEIEQLLKKINNGTVS